MQITKERPKLRTAAIAAPAADLNEEQALFLEYLFEWFVDRRNVQPLVLNGAAGTGKSHTLVRGLRSLGLSPRQVRICAPMVASANNVASMLAAGGLHGYESTTAHKLYRMRLDYKTGQWASIGVHRSAWDGVRLLIVDEAYTLGDDITSALLQLTPKEVKILFVGDSYQLPPVISDKSRVQKIADPAALADPFRLSPIATMDAQKFSLKKIMRQDGGNTLLLGASIRAAIDFADAMLPKVWAENKARKKDCSVLKMAQAIGMDETVRHAGSIDELEQGLIDAFKAGKRAKFLAWTNKVVDRANDRCFKALFPGAAHSFVPGAFVQLQEHWRNGESEVILPSTTEGFVISEQPCSKWVLGEEIPCHALVVDFGGEIGLMPMIMPTIAGLESIANIKKAVRHRAKKDVIEVSHEMSWNELRSELELFDAPEAAGSLWKFMRAGDGGDVAIAEEIYALLQLKKIRFVGDVAMLVSDMFSPFAELSHGYASTVHKAQGQTYDQTFFCNDLTEFYLGTIEEKDGEWIRKYLGCDPRMALRLIYVAMSRHKEFVMFIDNSTSGQNAGGRVE